MTQSNLYPITGNLPDTLWYTRCPVPTATSIAIQKGWLPDAFKADGIALNPLRVSSDDKVRESHFTHSQENSFREGGNIPPLYAKSQGTDTALIGLAWTPQYQGILTLPDSGIQTVADLKGRRLALPHRVNDTIDFWQASSLQGYAHALKSVNLSLSDVTLVDLPVEERFLDKGQGTGIGVISVGQIHRHHTRELIALLKGEVDAIFAYSAWGVLIKEQFSAVEVINLAKVSDIHLQVNNGQPKTLTVSRGLLRNHPELVDRYVFELLKAARWAKQNASEARRIIALEIGSAEYFIDEGTSEAIEQNLELSLDQRLIDFIAYRKESLLKFGYLKNDFNLEDWIDRGPIERALQKLNALEKQNSKVA
jgi:ABC-type nitrate/sulfonate/bicarbonate transport system substrate-binding protein